MQRVIVRGCESNEGHANDEEGVEPIDVAVPVRPGNGSLRDVNLLQVILFRPEGLVVFCSVGDCASGNSLRLVQLGCRGPAGCR